MATYTNNFNLKKPAGTDLISINDFNNNADIIDAELKVNADHTAEQGQKIDEHLLDLSAHATKADTTYFVNSTNGNDTNTGLSVGSAFKTINKAISVLPQIINHTIEIIIGAGTYNEDVMIQNFIGGGTLNLTGGTNLQTAANFVVDSIHLNSCSTYIQITGFTFTKTTDHAIALALNAKRININYCRVVSASSYYGIMTNSNNLVHINNGEYSNRLAGISCDTSIIYNNSNVGSNNQYGISVARGGRVSITGTHPLGIISHFAQSGGGQVIQNIGASNLINNGYRYNDDGTIEQWGQVTINSVTGGSITQFGFTLPIAFPNLALTHAVSCWGTTSQDIYITSSAYMSLSTLNAYVKNPLTTQNITVYFRAIGK